MKFLLILTSAIIITGCITSPMQIKRDHIIGCVKDLKQNDASTMDSFEVCRQVYGLPKIVEPKGDVK
jgi:starvation-inducible outer membrane lipoprotein